MVVSSFALLACGGSGSEPKPEQLKLPPELVSLRDEMCACQDQACIDRASNRQIEWLKAQKPTGHAPTYSTHEIDVCASEAQQRVSTKRPDLKAIVAEASKVPACLAPIAAALAKLPADTWKSDDEIKPANLDALRTAVGVEFIPALGGLKPHLDDEVARKKLGTVAPCSPADQPPATPIELAVVRVTTCIEVEADTKRSAAGDQKLYGAECHAALVWVTIAQPKVIARIALTFEGKPKKPAKDLTDAEAYKLAGSHAIEKTRELTSGQLIARLKAW